MRLWLDDMRDPAAFGCTGYVWVKNYDQAVAALATGKVTFASLDHDLSIETAYNHGVPPPGEKTGFDVICWMEENGVWPREGVVCHSANPTGRARMMQIIDRAYADGRLKPTPFFS